MAIRVICPGCMTSFEVDDRFAGKRGPCPKCGHIIEIPKEQVIIHAPDDITDGGKTRKLTGHDARPIKQQLITLSLTQVILGFVGVLVACGLSYLVGLAHSALISTIVGVIGAFLIAFPIADFGYMLVRDDNDLELLLGNERHKRAFFASLVFAGSWLIFEGLLYFLGGTGFIACIYLIPIAIVGSFGALIFFDCNFGKALTVYLVFAFAAIVCRGLILTDGYTPSGWIWQERMRSVASKRPAPKTETPPVPELPPQDTAEGEEQSASTPEKPAQEPAQPKSPQLGRDAPKVDLTSGQRRR